MRRSAALLLSAALLAATPNKSQAARDGSAPAANPARYELVVFEVDGCVYCEVFRRDVAPLYRASETGRKAPLRFINISRSDETGMKLSGSINIAPTVVLMHDGREVDRITGYTGPASFVRLVNTMLGQPD